MKYFLLSLLIGFSFSQSFADGWRSNEMQVKIEITGQQDIAIINNLKINYEPGNPALNAITAWLVPKELELVEAAGLSCEIEIKNLNDYYENFWLTDDAYHSYDEIIELADSLETHFPGICKRYVFGMDATGQYELTALKISDNVLTDEPEAEVLFDGGIHGDEIGGAENVIRFAHDLCLQYGNNPDITSLIDNREIWLYLMVNPWGRENMSRENSNGVDLNRDWAYMWDGWGGSTGYWSQPESKALRACMYNNQFVVHTTYHSGTEYISLPWSYRSSSPPDWNHINQLAGVYSSVSGYANLDYGQGNTGMYAINGSTKDSNYGIQGSITWSMEISYSKQPPASQIMMYYNYNYPSMISMIEHAGYGVQGTITDATNGNPVTAVVFVDDYMQCYSDPTAGDYHKYILPGTYSIKVVANGYQTQTIDNVVVTSNNATTTDFQLQPLDGQYVYKFSASQIAGNNEADEGNTKAVIGPPDNIYYSIGKGGWCILDMQFPVTDGAGPDIRVHEGSSSSEAYSLYAGETIDGPWLSMGTGTGTADFDLDLSGLPEAQFIKIVDDGDGSGNVADAGFDLDAIEVLAPISGVYIVLLDYEVDDNTGNNNGKIDPGETVDLNVVIKNNGDMLAENVEGLISTESSWINIDNENISLGDVSIGEMIEGTFTFTADENTPTGQPLEINLNITSNDGSYTSDFTMNFIVGQVPVLVLDLDPNHSSGSDIETAVMANGLSADYETSFPPDLNIYSSIFVCLGIYSDNHVLSGTEGSTLAIFVENGGRLYMEGGDTWAYDTQTTVHDMFKINGTADGDGDMGTVHGQANTFTEGMSFDYSGENNYMDHLEPIEEAFTILKNQSPSYGTAIAYDGGNYKTIGTSHEFGGLDDATFPSTKEELMHQYLVFFGLMQGDALVADFLADATEICINDEVSFSDNSAGTPISWSWIFEGGTPENSTEQNPTVTYNTSGTFDVVLAVWDGTINCTISKADYIHVSTTPDTPEMPDGEEEVCTNYTSTSDYTISAVSNANSYEWVISPSEAGVISGNATTGTVEWVFGWEGTATISAKAMNDCGESDYSENLEVLCWFCSGIDENQNMISDIYPNPSNGTFTLKTDNRLKQISGLRIINSLGETIYFANNIIIVNSQLQISLENKKPGIYFITIETNNTQIREKIIIK
jgi:PKD repeat protein